MSQVHDMSETQETMALYLLAIRGTLAPATLEDARSIHNQTAGAPQNVAAARSLGDLSHMVYVPVNQPGAGGGEFLILDVWNSRDGLNQFFANPQVQEQAGQIFSTRDPVVWTPAAGFLSYQLPTPHGKNERIVAVVRGTVRSRDAAQAIHNPLVASQINKSRMAGAVSHQAYFRLAPPEAPEALEFFAVDVWMSAAGMSEHYEDPEFVRGFQDLFAAPPTTSVWTHPAGDWVEW
jgi:quinol monooxygenase YgiN